MPTVHHLDAGPMRPYLGDQIIRGGVLPCRVVVIERDGGGLTLIDTGIGTRARTNPRRYLGPVPTLATRPDRSPERAAVAQVRALGLDPADVTDILITHLDFDHASGLADFPDARVHLSQRELDAALRPHPLERARYVQANWSEATQWEPFGQEPPTQEIAGLPAYANVGGTGLWAIPLPGHTRGHTGYAIELDGELLIHAGDAFYNASQLVHGGVVPRGILIFERLAAALPKLTAANHVRLIAANREPGVTVICSHDPALISRIPAAAR